LSLRCPAVFQYIEVMKTGGLTVKAYKWTFKARFRRHAFGWRSKPAIQRVKEAVSEIKKVARENPVLGAEGAVTFLERVSPALEQVDSSSGAIGTAVNNAIVALVPVIA
jgi:broad specificity phosphatase PhoE